MKKKYRVTKNEEFDKLISKKRFVASKSFTVYYYPKKLTYARVGISVPTRLGNAVTRNKIKRQIRNMLSDFPYYNYPFDCIIIARASFLKKDYEKNRNDLEKLLKTVKM